MSADVKGSTGIVNVRSYTNKSPQEMEKEGLEVHLALKDAEGTEAGAANGTSAVIKVPKAHLWNGVKDPYLYSLTAQLCRGQDVLDEVTVSCGIRTFSFDANKGFFLNGVSYPLRGVSRHQDWKGIGNAISRKQMEQDMQYGSPTTSIPGIFMICATAREWLCGRRSRIYPRICQMERTIRFSRCGS